MHKSHIAVTEHLEHVKAQVSNLQQQQQQQQQSSAHATWANASFLVMFLVLINFAAFLVNIQASFQFPFWAAKQAVGTLWVKQVLDVVLPATNTSVILILCVQAIKAAWNCLRW
jgi:uncharacterized membrane protein